MLDCVTPYLQITSRICEKGNKNMANTEAASPHSTKQTILVVDDEKTIVRLCVLILEHAGFSVLPSTDSAEALEIAEHHPGPIHLLLTDLLMHPPASSASGANKFPYAHGHELALQVLRLRKDLRVIIMSGNFDQKLAGYGIRRGRLPFLPKPFEAKALVALVQQTLQEPPLSIESLTAGATGKVLVGGDGGFD
jgi:DNA-binding NtrC family response regulator